MLQELHSTPLAGHFGRDKTLALARSSVWWPGLSSAVEEYIRTCPTCQRVKSDHLPPAGLLFPLPVPTRRGGCNGVHRSGHDFVQVHIDLLTGRVWLVPTTKTRTAEHVPPRRPGDPAYLRGTSSTYRSTAAPSPPGPPGRGYRRRWQAGV